MKLGGWLALARMLRANGKEVVLSTLTLIEAESELAQVGKVCANGECAVEANDMSAVHYLSKAGVPFVTGPSVNLYSGEALQVLHTMGLKRWVLPVELSFDHLKLILLRLQELGVNDLETEVFSYGYLPLACSARCFTARNEALGKDNRQSGCIKSLSGIPLATQESDRLFTLNGIQILSGSCQNILDQWQMMQACGVRAMRFAGGCLWAITSLFKASGKQREMLKRNGELFSFQTVEQVFDAQPQLRIALNHQSALEKQSVQVFPEAGQMQKALLLP